jgi:hypothetical protein
MDRLGFRLVRVQSKRVDLTYLRLDEEPTMVVTLGTWHRPRCSPRVVGAWSKGVALGPSDDRELCDLDGDEADIVVIDDVVGVGHPTTPTQRRSGPPLGVVVVPMNLDSCTNSRSYIVLTTGNRQICEAKNLIDKGKVVVDS